MKTLIARTLEIARGEVGVRETPRNRGRRVEQYLKACGLPGGYAWCSAFVAWCAKEAAASEKTLCPLVLTADCDVLLAFARKHDILFSTPAPGDVFLVMASPNDAHHTGFVTAVTPGMTGGDGDAFETVEGNTNLAGHREGIGVFTRTRRIGTRSGASKRRYRFVRWEQLVTESDAVTASRDTTPLPPPEPFMLYLEDALIAEMPLVAGMALAPVRAVGNALGLPVAWDGEAQAVRLGGRDYPGEVTVREGVGYVPVRPLARFLGLSLSVDAAARRVTLQQPSSPQAVTAETRV